MITQNQLRGLFIGAVPSMLVGHPPSYTGLSEPPLALRIRFAQQVVHLKKSGPASEFRNACLLIERLFVEGDDEVQQEARSLLTSVFAEAHGARINFDTLAADFGPRTLKTFESMQRTKPSMRSLWYSMIKRWKAIH